MVSKYRLEPHGSVFVFVSPDIVPPPTLKYQDRTLIRYMDRIFLPRRPSELTADEVRDANVIRLLLGPEVIDSKYTQQTLSFIYHRATKARGDLRVLDFGCGDGNITSLFLTLPPAKRPAEVVGIDISRFAVGRAQERLATVRCGTAIVLSDNSPFNLETGYFDAIVANFVLHFPLSEMQAQQLFRVLAPEGKFVYNDYMFAKDPDHHARVTKLLAQVGFRVLHSIERFSRALGDRVDLVEQAIVECIKPSRTLKS